MYMLFVTFVTYQVSNHVYSVVDVFYCFFFLHHGLGTTDEN